MESSYLAIMNKKIIRPIAICVFENENRILTYSHYDEVKKLPFHRPIGGGLDYQETSESCIIRESREELAQEIEEVALVGILENIFTYEGNPKHEIVFVYNAQFKDKTIYSKQELKVTEDNREEFTACWRELNYFDDYQRLVPEGLKRLLLNK